MERYKPLILAAIVFLFLGATSPASGEKELIIKLQGEVIVLQRQIRDLQESFDKWHGQSAASLQKISDNTSSTTRDISLIGDTLKNVQASQNNNLAGSSSQLQRIAEQISRQNQNFSSISDQINTLKSSLQEYQQKIESKDKSEKSNIPTDHQLSLASANEQFNKGNYETAINQLRTYLNTNGQNEESDDAIFLIGESLFSLARYNEALKEYDRILADYSRGDKATSALYKKGITLLHLERRNEGINTLKSIINQSPSSREAALAKAELSRLGEESSPSVNQTSPPQNRQRPS